GGDPGQRDPPLVELAPGHLEDRGGPARGEDPGGQRGPPVDEAVRDVHGRRTYCWPLAAARSLHQAPATLRAVPGDLQEVEALLRAHGGRSTPARRAVIRALLAADDHHVTAPELLAAIRQDRTSVVQVGAAD